MNSQSGVSPDSSSQVPCEVCGARATFHIADISRRGDLTERHLCDPCARGVLTKPYQRAALLLHLPSSGEVRIEVSRVVIAEAYDQQIIVFRELDGERKCLLLIGIFEATAILRHLQGMRAPRPLTHEAWLLTIEALNAKVQMACITRLSESLENAYLAELRLEHYGSITCVDLRPSDAAMIALVAGCPIMITNELLSRADESIEWGV